MMSDETFFQHIPPIDNITEITHTEYYYDAPEDWYIALTDVINSTQAIENGKYKDVNSVAAATITAMLNRVPGIDLPFMFGGDGATILLPPSVIAEAWGSLLATQQLAREAFGLELRAGVVPIKDVLEAGFSIKVARLKMSDNFYQAIFTGGGTAYADKLLKDPTRNAGYLVQGTGQYEADFTGFECRWNEVRSPSDETISLLVQAMSGDDLQSNMVYREVLARIDEIYGNSIKRHPITRKNLRMRFSPFAFWTEARIKFNDTSLRVLWRMAVNTFKARVAMRFDIQGWGAYPGLLIGATDNEKFDDTLRMTISGTAQQRETLQIFLDGKRRRGELVYGIHTGQYALVTCIVFDHFGRQVHFVDGSDGGYALAAKAMKAQLKETQEIAALKSLG